MPGPHIELDIPDPRTAAPEAVPARPLAAGTPEELARLRGELDRMSV